jgi:Photosystem I psaA/psaB protein
VLFARSSRLIPDKANLGFRFPCDGPGRGGTCQVSAWDHVFLGLFWMVRHVPAVTRLRRNGTNVGSLTLNTFNNNLGSVGGACAY